jgi:hypothetical protein
MVVDDVRVRLRQKLEAAFGAEEASILMDRPPGGWNDLVTNQMLDAKLTAMEHRLIATMEREFKNQTWKLLSAVFVAFAVFAALVRTT